MCVQIAHTAVYQFPILLRGIGVPEPVEGQGLALVGVLDGSPIRHDKKLKTVDSPIRGHIIRYQQFVSTHRVRKLFFHGNGDLLVDRDSADLAALALDRNGIFPQRIFRNGRVDSETLMDAKTGIAGQIQGQNVIIPIFCQCSAQHAVEFFRAPSTIILSESAALQDDPQLMIAGEPVLAVRLVMEEADGRQICFDGAGRLARILHVDYVADQMLPTDVGKFLQMILIRKVGAEPLLSFIIPTLRMIAALPVVPGNTIQL